LSARFSDVASESDAANNSADDYTYTVSDISDMNDTPKITASGRFKFEFQADTLARKDHKYGHTKEYVTNTEEESASENEEDTSMVKRRVFMDSPSSSHMPGMFARVQELDAFVQEEGESEDVSEGISEEEGSDDAIEQSREEANEHEGKRSLHFEDDAEIKSNKFVVHRAGDTLAGEGSTLNANDDADVSTLHALHALHTSDEFEFKSYAQVQQEQMHEAAQQREAQLQNATQTLPDAMVANSHNISTGDFIESANSSLDSLFDSIVTSNDLNINKGSEGDSRVHSNDDVDDPCLDSFEDEEDGFNSSQSFDDYKQLISQLPHPTLKFSQNLTTTTSFKQSAPKPLSTPTKPLASFPEDARAVANTVSSNLKTILATSTGPHVSTELKNVLPKSIPIFVQQPTATIIHRKPHPTGIPASSRNNNTDASTALPSGNLHNNNNNNNNNSINSNNNIDYNNSNNANNGNNKENTNLRSPVRQHSQHLPSFLQAPTVLSVTKPAVVTHKHRALADSNPNIPHLASIKADASKAPKINKSEYNAEERHRGRGRVENFQ
jgi:hypothetical protein